MRCRETRLSRFPHHRNSVAPYGGASSSVNSFTEARASCSVIHHPRLLTAGFFHSVPCSKHKSARLSQVGQRKVRSNIDATICRDLFVAKVEGRYLRSAVCDLLRNNRGIRGTRCVVLNANDDLNNVTHLIPPCCRNLDTAERSRLHRDVQVIRARVSSRSFLRSRRSLRR